MRTNNEQQCQKILTYLICFDIIKIALSKLENTKVISPSDLATIISDKFIAESEKTQKAGD